MLRDERAEGISSIQPSNNRSDKDILIDFVIAKSKQVIREHLTKIDKEVRNIAKGKNFKK